MYRVDRVESERRVLVARQEQVVGAVVSALVVDRWEGPVVVIDVEGRRTSWDKLGGTGEYMNSYTGLCRGIVESGKVDGRCEIETSDGRLYEVREEC